MQGMNPVHAGLIRASLFCLRLTTLLPYSVLVKLGTALGHLSYWLMPSRRKIARINIDLCFPELSKKEKTRLIKGTFCSMAITIFETGLCWWASDKKLAPLCHLTGLEHLEQAKRDNKGVLLLGAHFTGIEFGGRLLSMHLPFSYMFKPPSNPVVESIASKARKDHYQQAIMYNDLRGFVTALKQKKVCWMAPDQDLGMHRSIFAPFFGVQTATITAPSRFTKISGAIVVPFFSVRRKDNKGFDLQILPPLDDFPSEDLLKDATRINALIESRIRLTPDQYLWAHRRFKTRPPGEADLYKKQTG